MSLVKYRRAGNAAAGAVIAKAAINAVSKIARNKSGSNKTATAMAENANITTHHYDANQVYRARRGNKKKAKRANRFAKKIHGVLEKVHANNFQVIVNFAPASSANDKQCFGALPAFLTSQGTPGVWDHISQLLVRAGNAARIHLTSALSETIIMNDGLNQAYVDLYYWIARRNIDASVAGNLDSVMTQGFAELTANNPAGGSSLDIQDYGVTPFQSPAFTRNVKILKKVRIKLPAGESTQIKQSIKLSRRLDKRYIEKFSMLGGLTRGICFIAYGTPTSAQPIAAPVLLRVTNNVNYSYRVIDPTAASGGTNKL